MKKGNFLNIFFATAIFYVSCPPMKIIKNTTAESLPVAASGFAECVMEQNSRRVLYENNGDTRLPMASTTKVATAITVLEVC